MARPRPGTKLAFVHRTLWRRDLAYRWAVLLGPPPLLGVTVAAGALALLQIYQARTPPQAAPWAHWTRPVSHEGQPFAETTSPLPPTDASGRYIGFQPGWRGVIQPISVDATMNPTVGSTRVASFTLSQPTIPLGRIVDAGPGSGLFAGTTIGSFVVQKPGVYAFSARLTRSAEQSANCMLWLETPRHRMLRNFNLNVGGQAVINYDTTEYRLEPGLLHLIMVAGCWRGQTMVGSGEIAVLVRRPGQTGLQPIAADELINPVQLSPPPPRPGATP